VVAVTRWRLFGHSRVRRMALTGYRVAGTGALPARRGRGRACRADELMPAAMKMAAEIASKAPLAAQLFKQSLNAIEEMSLRDRLSL